MMPTNLPSLAFAEDAVLGILFTNVCSKRQQKRLPTPSFPAVTTNAGITIPNVFLVFPSAFWVLALSQFFVVKPPLPSPGGP
jgi:hypothetical protein